MTSRKSRSLGKPQTECRALPGNLSIVVNNRHVSAVLF